jgi:hypothetical protein
MVKNKGYSYSFLAAEAVRLLSKGRFRELYLKIRAFYSEKASPVSISPLRDGSLIYIWTSPHTLFLADQIAEFFLSLGMRAEVVLGAMNKVAKPDLEIVLSPAHFDFPFTRAPRIVFQLEQTTSDRWFTDQYVNYMKSSLAVLEYSSFNIPNLISMGLSLDNVFYAPLGGSSTLFEECVAAPELERTSKSDVALVYGDFKGSSRRVNFLSLARRSLPSLKVIENTFGNSMRKELRSSGIVLDINYYSPGILATPRLWESLSLGNLVFSEKSLNWEEYPEVCELVNFTDEGDYEALVAKALEASESMISDVDRTRKWIQISEKRFRFMMSRALLGLGLVEESTYLENIELETDKAIVPLVLSLPETVERRERAVSSFPAQAKFFDGVKLSPGWVGCATSYKLLSTFLLAQGVSRAIICEDDAVLPPSYESDIRIIMDYLDSTEDDWDVFVGLTADFDYKTMIFDVQEFKGKRFIHSNKFTSTVFNIYSHSGLEKFASWQLDESVGQQENTIDRFLNQDSKLRVISLDKDIFGHDNRLSSTIWGHPNAEYDSMITFSKYIRYGLIYEWLDNSGDASVVGGGGVE